MNAKYLAASLGCGAGWGLIAYVLGHGYAPEEQLVAGVLCSPIIGLLVGVISSPAYSFSRVARAFVPPVLLYLSAALFALAMCIRSRTESDLPENLGGTLTGTTWNLFLLLPLVYITHHGLGYLRSPKPAR